MPTYGPIQISSSALKRWGSPTRQELFDHEAHLETPYDVIPHFDMLGTPSTAGSCSRWAYLWAISDFVPCSEVLRTPQTVGVM